MNENKSLNDDKKIRLESKIKTILNALNFDFKLSGSEYLKKILVDLCFFPNNIHKLSSTIILKIANQENSKVSLIDRNVRWAIKKAYEKGQLKKITYFKNLNKTPTTMQVVYWLFDFFICECLY